MSAREKIRTAPWRSFFYFITVMFVSVLGPLFVANEAIRYLPARATTVETGFMLGVLGALVAVALFSKAWYWFNLGEHFMRWDNWAETMQYPHSDMVSDRGDSSE